MCSTQLKCLICNESTATNRMVVEMCGHQKCRECFIDEKDGCSICIAASASQAIEKTQNLQSSSSSSQPEDLSANFSTEIGQGKRVRVIENVLISSKTSARNKLGPLSGARRKRPAHITVTKGDNGKVIAYTCTICKKCFKSRNNQHYHFYCDKSQPKPYECSQCGKQFVTQSHLQYHEQTHGNKIFRCNECDREFSAEIGLRRHARKHTNEFQFECKMCDQRFRYKEQLNAHENRHNNIFHECNVCAMQFLMKSNLTKHMLAHAGKNQEMCTICRKMYSGKSALKVHMLTHSNQRQFQCTSCMKTFIDQRTLDRHLRTHSNNRYYDCTLCQAKSTRKDNIRRHVRNLHAATDVDVQTILDDIFRKYADRNGQTDSDHHSKMMRKKEKTEKNPGISEASSSTATVIEHCLREDRKRVENAPTSVIKFVGKATASIDLVIDKSRSITLTPPRDDLPELDRFPARRSTNTESDAASEWNTFECGVEIPTYQPLTLDPIPQMQPLPLLTTRNNSNLSVYRQLLSPYLRRAN